MYALLVSCLLVVAFAHPGPKEDFKEIEDDLSYYFDQHVDSRVVGGTVAPDGSVPYMVALTTGLIVRSLSCGGSIVSSTHVLTAAHCINAGPSGLSPHLRGTVGTNLFNRGGVMYSFSRHIIHENYVSSTIKNDIGFLITTEPIWFSPIISPVTLSYQHIDGGVPARAAGWGRISAGGAISQALLEVILNTMGGQECVDAVRQHRIDNNMNPDAPNVVPVDPAVELCTFHSVGHGVCNGDSGSALVEVSSGLQVGIVSWGHPCAIGAPDVFVRVSSFEDWIKDKLQNA